MKTFPEKINFNPFSLFMELVFKTLTTIIGQIWTSFTKWNTSYLTISLDQAVNEVDLISKTVIKKVDTLLF